METKLCSNCEYLQKHTPFEKGIEYADYQLDVCNSRKLPNGEYRPSYIFDMTNICTSWTKKKNLENS